MKRLFDIELPDTRYKILKSYRYEIVDVICPFCKGLTEFTEDLENVCSVCGNIINPCDIGGHDDF